jgi:opacity protein-like surface antigen
MRSKTVGLLAALCLMLLAMPAAAQTPMTWSGSLYAGYAKMQEDEDVAPVPGGSIGVRGNMFAMVSPAIGLGAELGWHNFGTEEFDDGLGGTSEFKASAIQATGQMRARAVTGTMRPYGTAGLGLYSLKGEVDGESETEGKFGFNLGAGVQFMPNPTSTMSFGLEARWHMIMDGWINEDLEESALDVITVMAGVNFR